MPGRYLLLILFAALWLSSCTESMQMDTEEQTIKAPKFHSAENEGHWQEMSADHLPRAKRISGDSIEISVPLEHRTNPRHYIEVLVLMQGEKKQIKAVSFKPTDRQAKAIFELPDSQTDNYYIIGKCNLHDMWRVKLSDALKAAD